MTWHNDYELFPELPWRKWIREHLPSGSDGFTAEDLDLVTCVYKPGLDPFGAFMLIEVKYKNSNLSKSKLYLFGLMDYLFRKADPEGQRYKGFYVLCYSGADPNDFSNITINGTLVTEEQLKDWFLFKHNIPSWPLRWTTYSPKDEEQSETKLHEVMG